MAGLVKSAITHQIFAAEIRLYFLSARLGDFASEFYEGVFECVQPNRKRVAPL
jgi:hypothetical protein